jgi:regulator of protease activity HflC (stomatin/prohibitin superfamily)
MKTIGKVLILAFAALTMAACRGPVVFIQPGEVGVVFNILTGELKDPIGPGMYILPPMIDEVTIYSTQLQEYTMSGSVIHGAAPGGDAIPGFTSDGQEISVGVTVIYAINPAEVNLIHQRWQNQYIDNFVRPMVRNTARTFIARYTARSICCSEDRENLQDDIQLALESQFEKEGLILNSFLLREIDFSESFSEEIEAEFIATMTAEAQASATPTP